MGSKIELAVYTTQEGFGPDLRDSVLDIFSTSCIPVIVSPFALFDEEHISIGAMHAARFIRRGTARARDPAMEVIRCLSGMHQISSALEMMSPHPGSMEFLVILLPDGWPDPEDGNGPLDICWITNRTEVPGAKEVALPALGGSSALERIGMRSTGDHATDKKALIEHLASLQWD